MYDLYIDSTLHNDWNLKFNRKLCNVLEKKGIRVYLPQRDTDQKYRDRIFQNNISGINNSNKLLAIACNESPNWGVEVGYAHGIGKEIVILKQKDHTLPLMASHMCTSLVEVESLEKIEEYLDKVIKAIKK